jgi:arylsulfate sulfotransferase
MQKIPLLSFLIFVVVVSASGCGGQQQQQQPPQAVSVSVSPQSALISAGQSTQFMAQVTGDSTGVTWSVNGTVGGDSTVGTIDAAGNYTAPALTANGTATITAISKRDTTKSASASATIVALGVVTSTANVQVASYTISPPATANVGIDFGPDTTYGLTTWQQPSPAGGGAVTILVAGMKLNTTYHMRAVSTFADGSKFNDTDHTFVTGDIPTANLPNMAVTTSPGATPQSGVELLDLVSGNVQKQILVTDLAGNVIWTYDTGMAEAVIANPIKLLPNGHFLINLSLGAPSGVGSTLLEVDLTGQVIWKLAFNDLNKALAVATCAGCNITIVGTHHDFVALPNGHIVVIASENKVETGLVGFPNPVTVSGDVLIDLDENHKPVWVWSEFDHLDLNRHPMAFPDWTHTNGVVYSPDDKSLIVSIRHQDWVVKVDYNDGQGTGNILWKLGYQGDFTLQNGTDPIDWFYAQHDVSVVSSNSSGIFQLLLFDNGNQRVLDSSGTICGVTGTPPCVSHVPILQLDETAKTASIQWSDDLSPLFSVFGGSARLLANGNVEFAECAPTVTGTNLANGTGAIFEVTKTTPPQTVWQMEITGQNIYRGIRIPSLYPGVQW